MNYFRFTIYVRVQGIHKLGVCGIQTLLWGHSSELGPRGIQRCTNVVSVKNHDAYYSRPGVQIPGVISILKNSP